MLIPLFMTNLIYEPLHKDPEVQVILVWALKKIFLPLWSYNKNFSYAPVHVFQHNLIWTNQLLLFSYSEVKIIFNFDDRDKYFHQPPTSWTTSQSVYKGLNVWTILKIKFYYRHQQRYKEPIVVMFWPQLIIDSCVYLYVINVAYLISLL